MVLKKQSQGEWNSILIGLVLTFFLSLIALAILATMSGILALPPNTIGGVLLGLGSFMTVSIVFWSKYKERQSQIEQEHRLQKAKVFEEFVEFIITKVLLGKRLNGKLPTPEETIRELFAFKQRSIIWGSENLILQVNKSFKDFTTAQGIDVTFAFEDLLCAIRADLGHQDKNLRKGDLLRAFVIDIDNYC